MKGRFRIQSVAEMTGVPASTLRAWEQRYGFPAPERTASAYRVYSQDDIDLIAAVRARCDAGMAPAEAVAEVLESASQPSEPPPAARRVAPPKRPKARAAANASLVDRIVAAAHAADPVQLDEAVRSCLMLGSGAIAHESALAPAWARLRSDWNEGRLDSAVARIAMEIMGHAARDLIRLRQPSTDRVALIATMPDEDDVVGLVPAALDAQSEGLRAVLIAPRTSTRVLGQAAETLDAVWVAVAFAEAPTLRAAREWIEDFAPRVAPRRWRIYGPGSSALGELVAAHGGDVFDLADRA